MQQPAQFKELLPSNIYIQHIRSIPSLLCMTKAKKPRSESETKFTPELSVILFTYPVQLSFVAQKKDIWFQLCVEKND